MNVPNAFFSRTALLGAVLALVGAGPRLAAAAERDPAAAPIEIGGCTMSEDPTPQNPERAGPRTSTVAGLTVELTNERDVAATGIRLRVRYRGQKFTFDDRGTFAPHLKLTREFTKINSVFAGDSADCSVISVTFADGTRWDAPPETASPAPTPPHGG